MDCSRTSIRQGAVRGDARLPPRHEGHAGGERGPRGDRGRRHARSSRPARRGSSPTPRATVTGVEFIRMKPGAPDASGRRRPEPAPGHGVHDPLRPGPAGDRPGPGARPGSGPARTGRRRPRTTPPQGRRGHVRDRTGPACSAPATSGSARRPSSRRSPRAAARPTPSTRTSRATTWRRSRPARRWPSRSPSSSRSCRSRASVKEPRYRLKAMAAEVRNKSYIEYEIPYTPRGGRRRVDALPPVHVRGDRLLRPAPPRDRVRHDAPDARAAVPPGRRLPERDREPLHRHQPRLHPRRLATRSSSASRRAASTAAAAPRSARRSSARPATTSCGSASTRSSRRRST